MTDADGPPVVAVEAELERALGAYGGFLAHQLSELALLAGAARESPAAVDRLAARLTRMVADLNDLSAVVGTTQSLDLGAEAEHVAAELDEPGRRVAVEVKHRSVRAAADQGLLRALLGHLMRPSVAASRSGVVFELRVCETGDGRVLIELEDDGGAPSDEDARRRLLAFARPDGGGPLLGAGVSGPAARRIVAGHGGVLSVRPGDHGLVAEFELPAASGP